MKFLKPEKTNIHVYVIEKHQHRETPASRKHQHPEKRALPRIACLRVLLRKPSSQGRKAVVLNDGRCGSPGGSTVSYFRRRQADHLQTRCRLATFRVITLRFEWTRLDNFKKSRAPHSGDPTREAWGLRLHFKTTTATPPATKRIKFSANFKITHFKLSCC